MHFSKMHSRLRTMIDPAQPAAAGRATPDAAGDGRDRLVSAPTKDGGDYGRATKKAKFGLTLSQESGVRTDFCPNCLTHILNSNLSQIISNQTLVRFFTGFHFRFLAFHCHHCLDTLRKKQQAPRRAALQQS